MPACGGALEHSQLLLKEQILGNERLTPLGPCGVASVNLKCANRARIAFIIGGINARIVNPPSLVPNCFASLPKCAKFLEEAPVAAPKVNDEAPKPAGRFSTTRWSVVLLAGHGFSSESMAALEKLCRTYWQPIFLFARRKGCGEEDAKDLTQQFFARLLERNDFSGLDPSRGKFRTFLLTAFTHFLANEYDRAGALKRGGGRQIFSLEEFAPDELSDTFAAAMAAPGTLFDLRWARTILQTALQNLKQEMSVAKKAAQFEILKPFLTVNAGEGDYATAAQRLGVEVSSVPVLVHRLRQRYHALVREEVAQTVTSPVELAEEMRHLFEVLNQ